MKVNKIKFIFKSRYIFNFLTRLKVNVGGLLKNKIFVLTSISLFIINRLYPGYSILGLNCTGELFQNVIKVFIKGSSNVSQCSSETTDPKSPPRVDGNEGNIDQGAVLVHEHGVSPVDAHVGRGVRR